MFKELFTESEKWIIYNVDTGERPNQKSWTKIQTARKNAEKMGDRFVVADEAWYYQNINDKNILKSNGENQLKRRK